MAGMNEGEENTNSDYIQDAVWGNTFRNVWTDDEGKQHQCCNCGEVVSGFQGMINHKCKEVSNG